MRSMKLICVVMCSLFIVGAFAGALFKQKELMIGNLVIAAVFFTFYKLSKEAENITEP